MPTIGTTPTTVMQTSRSLANGRKIFRFRAIVNLTTGSAYQSVGLNIPARSRIVWAYCVNQTAINMTGGITTDATNAFNAVALLMSPTTNTTALTAPVTNTASAPAGGTNGYMVALIAATTSNSLFRGAPHAQSLSTTGLAQNTNTVPALLTLVPANTNSNRISPNATVSNVWGTSTDTSTSTAGQVLVDVECEEFEDNWTWPNN